MKTIQEKTFNLREAAYHIQVVENENIMFTITNNIYFYSKGEIIVKACSTYLSSTEVDNENNKIVHSFSDKTIKEFTFNSDLRRKNKFTLDGSSFIYKGDLYICLDNEDYEVKEYLHYDEDTYKSYSTVIRINDTYIWCAITRTEEKFIKSVKDELDDFFDRNMLNGYNKVYTERLLMLSDDKREELIRLLQSGKNKYLKGRLC